MDYTQTFSPVQEISDNLFFDKEIKLYVKRDDLIHPEISGNKWRKLKYNIQQAQITGQKTLLTFGGAFSNHIAGLAAAGEVFDFHTIGLIRGEKVIPLNPTLSFALESGMQLHFLTRSEYKKRKDEDFVNNLKNRFGQFYLIPEGGTNQLAIKGCSEIVTEVKQQFNGMPDYWCVSCGTGGTVSGIIKGLNNQGKVIGFSALKGDFLQKEIEKLIERPYQNWSINNRYHFGGYAKYQPELINFINHFKKTNAIPLDPIYTGKLFYGIYDLIKNDYFPRGSSILAVHTGGLQGIAGFNKRFGNIIQ